MHVGEMKIKLRCGRTLELERTGQPASWHGSSNPPDQTSKIVNLTAVEES